MKVERGELVSLESGQRAPDDRARGRPEVGVIGGRDRGPNEVTRRHFDGRRGGGFDIGHTIDVQRLPAPPRLAPGMSEDRPFLGLVGGAAQWLFLRGDVVSLTVSAAAELAERPSEEIAERFWADTAVALDLDPDERPPIRIVKERRATFAQTPEALRRRAPARTKWRNLVLAGDWTDTGFPATIESAVRSGRAAAGIVTEN